MSNPHRVYMGISGTGKSWLASKHQEDRISSGKFTIIFDPHNEHRGLGDHFKFVKLVFGERAVDALTPEKALQILKRYKNQKGIRLATNKLYQDKYMHLVDCFSWAILETSNIDFMIDECMNVAPNKKGAPINLKKLVTEGRKYNCGVALIIQRPQQVDTELISQPNVFHVFRLVDKNDIERVRGQVENSEEIRNLKNREYVYVNKDLGIQKKETTNGMTRMAKHYGRFE